MTEVFVILMVEVACIMHDCMSMKNIPSGVEPYICNHNWFVLVTCMYMYIMLNLVLMID